jgi:hypothetical protein
MDGEPNDPTQVGIVSRGSCSTTTAGISARVDAISAWADHLIAAATPTAAPTTTTTSTGPTTTTSPTALAPLGTLTATAAKADIRRVLIGLFHSRFQHGTQIQLDCVRASPTKMLCDPSWAHDGTDFYGGVTVFLTREANQVVWTDHYAIRSVNPNCDRNRCPVTTRKGAF